jgi:hypothetical protein
MRGYPTTSGTRAHMYEILILLVLINLGFTGHIWRTFRRGPKRKFLTQLLDGEPITPKHATSSLQNGIELFISDADRRFFSDIEMFADALNHRFEPNEPWRVQELPNAELTGREELDYGRRYEIFYNKYSVGNLQIFAVIPTTQIISKSERKLNCTTLGYCRLPRSKGLFLRLLISPRLGMPKKLCAFPIHSMKPC